ncbi:hypothetical protein CR513_00601, partial [Mucuna pruriens]
MADSVLQGSSWNRLTEPKWSQLSEPKWNRPKNLPLSLIPTQHASIAYLKKKKKKKREKKSHASCYIKLITEISENGNGGVVLGQTTTSCPGQWRRSFEKLHNNLLRLLEVETQPAALEALFQYYDSPVRCFTFKDFQMAPTLEEYEGLLGLLLTESPHYFHQAQPPSWTTIAKLLRVSEAEMSKRRRNRNGLEGVPRVYIEKRFLQFQEEQDWAAVIDILGLLLYGVVLFPYVQDYVNLPAIEVFLAKRDRGRTLPWPFWLTLTTRSIIAANGRLGISDAAPPTLPMLGEASKRTIHWYPAWNEREQMITRCRGYPNVPLLRTQGAINYNPELTSRQAGYPMVRAPLQEALTPILLEGSQAHKGEHHRKIRQAWTRVIRQGATWRTRSCGASPELQDLA